MYDKTIHDTMHDIVEHEKREYGKKVLGERDIEIAKDMIKEGFPTNIISKISKLDLNSVKKLQLEK